MNSHRPAFDRILAWSARHSDVTPLDGTDRNSPTFGILRNMVLELGGEVPTALDTQTTAPDGTSGAKSVEADAPWLSPAKWDELHRFERLVERIADWSDDELSAVDARQTRHIARVVCDGANPEYPNFAAGQAQDSETDASATQVAGGNVSASSGPEIRIAELERERDTARDLAVLFRDTLQGVRDRINPMDVDDVAKMIDAALATEGMTSGDAKEAAHYAAVGALKEEGKGEPAKPAETFEIHPVCGYCRAEIRGGHEAMREHIRLSHNGTGKPIEPTQEEQRATFEAIADEPRPSAVEVKEHLDGLEREAAYLERSEKWGGEQGGFMGRDFAHFLRCKAVALDSLAVHCLALEIERDDLAAKLDRIAEQAKPVDGTDLAELCQIGQLNADRIRTGESALSGPAIANCIDRLIGAVNDQARKLAERGEAFDITKPKDVRQDALLAIDVLERFGSQAGHLTEGDARKCAKSMRALLVDRDRMEPARDAATDVVKDLEHDLAACRSELAKADERWAAVVEERETERSRAEGFRQAIIDSAGEISSMAGERDAAVADRDKADAAHGCAVRDHRAELKRLALIMEAGAISLDQIEHAFVKETRRTAKLKRKLRKARARGVAPTYTAGEVVLAIDACSRFDRFMKPGGFMSGWHEGAKELLIHDIAKALGMRKAEA